MTSTLHVAFARPVSLLPAFFVFTSPPPPDFYTLSLHDALPILLFGLPLAWQNVLEGFHSQQYWLVGLSTLAIAVFPFASPGRDRKSTRLNSSHRCISYAVFCLKKKKLYLHTSNYRLNWQNAISC